VALAEQVNALTGGAAPFALDTLAMAYAQAGRFNDAQQVARRAIDMAAEAGITNDVTAMQERLELYRSGRPYREPAKSAQ
jgi:spermidine synthase